MNSQKERGFTIVELLLALSLLSFIMVFALVILTQLIATYNKSLTLTQINQAIRQLDNDVAKGLRFVSPATFKAYQFGRDGGQIQYADDRVIAWSHADYVIVGDKGGGGMFCAKDVSYIWNLGTLGPFAFRYPLDDNDKDRIRLIRVEDNICNKVQPEDAASNVMAYVNTLDRSKINALLGRQSMVLQANVKKHDDKKTLEDVDLGNNGLGVLETSVGRLAEINLVLSTAGQFKATYTAGGDSHLTCEDTRSQNFCSFGEFNSIIYMRGK